MKVKFAAARLAFGFGLIAATSAALLLSDLNQRKQSSGPVPRIAILQHASQALLDETVEGILQGLRDSGFRDGETIEIKRYNAENDLPTGNAIAKEITDGKFRMVVTASTLSMQAVATANKAGKTIHVFGAVADPFSAGIGVERETPAVHPPHLTGIGSFMPVDGSFELARTMFPGLKKVGVAWNPAESNSLAFTKKAREVSQKMGIELIETHVDSSSGVLEAASAIVSKGVQAIWIGGDVTVMVGVDSVVAAAKKGRIPVFTLTPPNAKRGALFDLGANFTTIGHQTGTLAAQILNGADPATIPVRDFVPPRLMVNQLALAGLRDPWRFPDDVLARADAIIDETGFHEKAPAAGTALPSAPTKTWNINIVKYVDSSASEEAHAGLLQGFKESGLVEGKDYTLRIRSAQGDMPTLNGLMDAVLTDNADLLITLSTPTLQTAIKKIKKTPVVFTLVGSAVVAGAGRSDEDHLPNFTGTTTVSPFDEMIALFKQIKPGARRIGTVFVPAEVNSAYYRELLQAAATKGGLQLEAVAATNSSDVADAALALVSRPLDAVMQLSDNLTANTFTSIAKAAERARLPIFSFNSNQVKQGATLALSKDFFDAAREAALMAAKVVRGADPAKMPIAPTLKTRLVIDVAKVRTYGLQIPPDVLKRADEVLGQ